jgi:glycosyltransferase involved in cell wall biosynthesis
MRHRNDLITCVCLTSWPRRGEMLAESLRSYALQTHSPRRMFVLNDGEPLRSLAPDVCVINLTEKITIGEKRNRGLELAGTSWVATWDDDDFALPEHLAFLLQDARARRLDHIHSGLFAMANSNLSIGCVIRRVAFGASILWAPTARRIGGYSYVSDGEDGAMYAKIVKTKTPTGIHPKLTYIYRRHRTNTTCQFDFGTRQDQRLTQCLEDQQRWPRVVIADLQTYLDHCRTTPTSPLVEPDERSR